MSDPSRRQFLDFKMWKRRTFHECATELEQISSKFRKAHLGLGYASESARQTALNSLSVEGVEILRILALAIRSEQDQGNIPSDITSVGALNRDFEEEKCAVFREAYASPASSIGGFQPLPLREALNKIAHADGPKSGYFSDSENHDLILFGKLGNRCWAAVISIPDLCRVVKELPDAPVPTA
jgi:hypothetical protein